MVVLNNQDHKAEFSVKHESESLKGQERAKSCNPGPLSQV